MNVLLALVLLVSCNTKPQGYYITSYPELSHISFNDSLLMDLTIEWYEELTQYIETSGRSPNHRWNFYLDRLTKINISDSLDMYNIGETVWVDGGADEYWIDTLDRYIQLDPVVLYDTAVLRLVLWHELGHGVFNYEHTCGDLYVMNETYNPIILDSIPWDQLKQDYWTYTGYDCDVWRFIQIMNRPSAHDWIFNY